MKKLMFATALVASAAAFADPINAISFEGYSADATVGNTADTPDTSGGDNGMYFYFDGDQDGSLVKAFGSGDVAAPSITRPLFFASAAQGNNYLELSTEGGILWRSINTLNSETSGESPVYSLGDAEPIADTGTYLDTLVQFTPTEGDGAPEVDKDSDKLAIWLNVDSQNHTNLMVRAAVVNIDGEPTATTFTITNKTVSAGAWYRLTIKAIPDISDGDEIPGFQIRLDGDVLMSDTPTLDSEYLEVKGDSEYGEELKNGALFASLLGTDSTPTLQGIGFKGSGALDDIVWTTEDPFDVPAAAFTLTWPSGVTPVSYSIDGGTAESLTGQTSSFSIPGGVVPGSTVAFTFTNADGATKTMEVVASASVNDIDAEDAVYVWSDYLGAAVNGAYTIDDANDLDMLRKGVAANLATVGETFNQTANIDMTSADPFAGIGTYAANLNSGLAFQGTYDGQGFKIANITMTARNYGGVFNQVKGGTIKDLTVENITAPANATGEFGYAIVGNAGLGATLQGLTAMGSFGTAELPCSHNVAGIAIRVCGGASNVVNGVTMLETLVKDCTNNATLYGFYTKCGGITALTQDQNGVPNDYVLFDGCVNNANIAMVQPSGSDLSKIGRDGLGGILAYVADGTKMQNCVNNGTLTSPLTTAKIGGIVGWAQGRTLDDLGGNKNPAAAKMIGDPSGSTITGFYATVDNGVATTVTALAKDTTYLLERNVPTNNVGEAEFTLAAAGDTIAFDAALGYTFAGTVGAAAPLVAIPSTSGTVTTYSTGYFPRTATAGQDGSAANPFELADADDLQALKAAFGTATYRAYNYKVVANIDATDLGYWDGIGTQGTAGTGLNGGTLDGSGYTISNLKFSAGKYRAFFNRLDNATIKDLTINVTGFEDTDAAEHGYAAFAGNMKGSLLLNCTATGTIGTTAKPAMHTCGGLAVKVDSVGTFVNCTNHIDIVCSLTDNPKIGGIVGLMQGGALTNCWNDGDLTITVKTCGNDGNGAGGLVGYAQTTGYTISGGGNAGTIQSTDTTTAASAQYPIHVGTIVGKTGSALTAVDGVVAPADAVSAGVRNNVNGLDFATVENNVATFVPNASLAAGNTYKVMLGGATAAYAFTEAGTIAFDTNLVQAVTFNITAPEGLTVTDATSAGVVTFTAGAPAPAYPTYLENADAAVKANYDTWAGSNGADTGSVYEKQFLLNAAPATEVPATALAITAIEQNATAGWDITVECTISGVDLSGTVGTAKAGNGYLAVSYTDDLTGTWTTENINITASANGKVTVNVNKSGAKFMKVKLSSTAEPQN